MPCERLRLTLAPGQDETFTGFVSRLAARNGAPSMRQFVEDMRLDAVRIRDGDPGMVEAISELSGCDAATLATNALRPCGTGWTVRGQSLSRITVNRTLTRLCPRCVEEDLAAPRAARQPGESAIRQRLAWQIASIRSCPFHGVALVALDGAKKGDFAQAVRRSLASVQGPFMHPRAAAWPLGSSEGDRYLSARLDGEQGPPWLDGLAFHVAARAMDVVGAVALRGRRPGIDLFTTQDWIAASNLGFDILQGGEGGLTAFLDRQIESYDWRSETGSAKAQAVHGFLHDWLARGAGHPDFEPVKRVFRDHILARFPIAAGEDVCGEMLEVRRLHSVKSAADAHGLHPQTTERVLVAGGLLEAAVARGHVHRRLVDACAADVLLARFASSLPLPATLERLGVNRTLGAALLTGGHLKPVVPSGRGEGVTPTYAVEDIDDLRARLLDGAEAVEATPSGCAVIATATKRLNCSWGEIVALILERKVWRGLLEGVARIEGLVVHLDEAARFVRAGEVDGLRFAEVAIMLDTAPAAIGVLVDHGRLPTRMVVNPLNRCPIRVVPTEAAEAFHAAHVGAWEASKRAGLSVNQIAKTLARHGLTAAIPKEEGKSPWFRRDEVERWLRPLGSSPAGSRSQ